MFHYFLEKFTVSKYHRIKSLILTLNGKLRQLGAKELEDKVNSLRQQLSQLTSKQSVFVSEDLLVTSYALIKEVIFREIKLDLFPTQVFGAIALYYGNIAQMNTGEGKTLTALLPVCLNALAGKTVYVVTVNEYLADRDWRIASPLFDYLKLSSGVNAASLNIDQKKSLYETQIVYTTGSQLGFDYLKSNLVRKHSEKISMKFEYVLIDEVDSILIDESRNPLIISNTKENVSENLSLSENYRQTFNFAKSLLIETDYKAEKSEDAIYFTSLGVQKVERFYQIKNLFEFINQEKNFEITGFLKAIEFYRRGVDYIVDREKQKIVIIDALTGRLVPNRVYGAGIHQMIEAKEGLPMSRRGKTVATITYQNFFRMFNTISGMTGTARDESDEFRRVYAMEVITVNPNRPLIREDKNDVIFVSKRSKYEAVIKLIRQNYSTARRPVLVGSPSLEVSQHLSRLLKLLKIKHARLNAVNNREEAEIIKKAGEVGAVTISTNMAGRGTDIILTPESSQKGGLLLIGLERNIIRRIDDQLKGRAGRQGNPGTTQFFVSLEDEFLKNYKVREKVENFFSQKLLSKFSGGQLSDKRIDFLISEPQESARINNSNIRQYTLGYDMIISRQRELIYWYRENLLETVDLFKFFAVKETHDKQLAEDDAILQLLQKKLRTELLISVDDFWSEYLECLEKLRNTIGLKVYSMQDPRSAYFSESNKIFYSNYYKLQAFNKNKTQEVADYYWSIQKITIDNNIDHSQLSLPKVQL